MGQRSRSLFGLWVLAELVVFVLVAWWIGIGWTILATLATSGLGLLLLGSQGTRALRELRDRARSGDDPGRALGDAGLVAAGGLLMVLPGFVGDLVGLLCLLPWTRAVPRALLGGLFKGRLPEGLRGPVQVRSVRVEEVDVTEVWRPGPGAAPGSPRVIEGEVADERSSPTPP